MTPRVTGRPDERTPNLYCRPFPGRWR